MPDKEVMPNKVFCSYGKNTVDCDNRQGDTNRPMCWICRQNPYLGLVTFLAKRIHHYKNNDIQWEIARSGTRWDAEESAWRIIKDMIDDGYVISKAEDDK
jgi:hypothetical protein